MAIIESTQPLDDLLNAGYEALAIGDWQAGRAHFQAAVDREATPEALEGLAMAAWWLDDAPVAFENHERAYRGYRQRGDRLGAGRIATWLGVDHYLYRGDLAIADGWLQRSHRLLDELEPCAEQGWLAIWEGHIALMERSDIAMAKRLAAEMFGLARRLRLIDLEMLALALEGLALVSEGEVAEGMRRLDESTTAALAGDMHDPDAIVTACCYLIYACLRIRDFDRATQWCRKAEEASRRWSYRSMFGVCRSHYAAVLIWRGEWSHAEKVLTTATRDLKATRPGWATEGIVRLAELRSRQGRLDDAAGLLQETPAHPLALLGRAELAFQRGQVQTAADLIERFFRRVPEEDRTERFAALELAVRIRLALGDIDQARASLEEMEAATTLIQTNPLRGAVSFARGLVAVAIADLDEARRCFEDAIDLFGDTGAPFETALARLELAQTLSIAGRNDAAAAEAREALNGFQRLGAERQADRAAELLRNLGAAPDTDLGDRALPDYLTRREAEVLSLVARGHSNQEIADRLFISVRTVERHISTIYEKLGASGTTARAIATAYAIEHGLVQSLDH